MAPAIENIALFVHLNVGGMTFLTTEETINKVPNSRLANMILPAKKANGQIGSNSSPICLDRSGWAFAYVLDFLREGENCLLPNSLRELDRILTEAEYFGLPDLVTHLKQALDLWIQQLAVGDQPNDDRYFLVRDQLVRVTRSAKARSPLLLDRFLPTNNPRRYGYTADRPMLINRDPELFRKCFGPTNPRDLLPWQVPKIHAPGPGPEGYWCPYTCRLGLHPYVDKLEEEAKHFQMRELLADIKKCRELHSDCHK